MIRLRQINKYYGQFHALKDIDLRVPLHSIFGIIGKSGAGKSTLLRCVNLLERPSSGRVEVGGKNLMALTEPELRKERHKIGMIFQQFNLLESLSVYDNIALPLVLAGTPSARIRDKLAPLLQLTELKDKTKAYPSQLSGGQQQRVAIARALANEPKVLLCDEATSALDHETTRTILDLLRTIHETLDLTILLITHEIEVIKTICGQVAVMDRGEIVEQNTLVDFLMHPKSPMGKMFSQAAIQQELPLTLRHKLVATPTPAHHPVLRVFFQGLAAETPIIAELVARFGFKLNILQASMEYIQHQPLGIMLLEIMNRVEQLPEAIHYLKQHGVLTEVIGYVGTTA